MIELFFMVIGAVSFCSFLALVIVQALYIFEKGRDISDMSDEEYEMFITENYECITKCRAERLKNMKDFKNEQEAVKAWPWMMDWCRENGMSPANQYFWNLAKEAYFNNEETNKENKGT